MGQSIGALASACGLKVPTIRFYEQIGLLPPPERSDINRRVYGPDAVKRLAFIKHARQLGFSVDAIRTLLDLADRTDQTCDDANAVAKAHLADVEHKIAQLESLRKELRRMVESDCEGPMGSCRVIETLADHALCAHDHDAPAHADHA